MLLKYEPGMERFKKHESWSRNRARRIRQLSNFEQAIRNIKGQSQRSTFDRIFKLITYLLLVNVKSLKKLWIKNS